LKHRSGLVSPAGTKGAAVRPSKASLGGKIGFFRLAFPALAPRGFAGRAAASYGWLAPLCYILGECAVPELDGIPTLHMSIRQAAGEVGIAALDDMSDHELILEIRRRSEITYEVLSRYIERHNAYRGFARWYEQRCQRGAVDETIDLYGNLLDSRAEDSRRLLLRHLYQAVLPSPDANLQTLHS
jgi:hypothetical protein